jgi:hypothetical protein
MFYDNIHKVKLRYTFTVAAQYMRLAYMYFVKSGLTSKRNDLVKVGLVTEDGIFKNFMMNNH